MLGIFKPKKKKNPIVRAIKKIIAILALIYGGLFCVFFFDLDGKLLYYIVEPFMKNHFDNMERRDPTKVPYEQINSEYMKK